MDEEVWEIGGGMNWKRKKYLALMDEVERYEVKRIVVAHKDRLVRLGFDGFAYLAEKPGAAKSRRN